MTMTRHLRLSLASSFVLLFSVSAATHAAPAPAAPGPYLDARIYLSGAQLDAWYDMTRRLKINFDDVCGDAFCEGEYSNIEALRYNCSVDQASGHIGMCAWTFAASNEEVDPVSGNILVQKGAWRCRTPLEPNVAIGELMTALAGSMPMYARLPGSDRTIMEGLVDDCFF